MKTQIFYSFLLLSFFFAFCKFESTDSQKFGNFFTSEETKELNKILNYFDEKVKNISSSGEIKECYEEFCQSILQDFKSGYITFDTIGLSNVYSQTFSKNIWLINTGTQRDSIGQLTNKLFCELNLKGKYLEFLKYNSKKNDFIKNYFEKLIQVGGIGPSSNTLMLRCDEIDFSNENVRLIFAIHWITYSCTYF
ncbi:MAG: hypothetical protein ACM3PT_02885 [Deltaproteobacteria bacterium]